MTPYYDWDGIMLYHGDCREVLPALGWPVVDAAITDPPYSVGKKYGENSDSLSSDVYLDWMNRNLQMLSRVTRDAVVFFPGVINLFSVPEMLDGTDLRPIRVLGWHRKEFAGDVWSSGPAMAWEPVVWASKAERPYFNKVFGIWGRDFLVVDATHGNWYRQHHPCPKPLPVMRWLVNLFVPKGGTVLDPFAGTGTTLEAAKQLGYHAIGIEREEEYCRLAVRRLSQEVLPLSWSDEATTLVDFREHV